jgi:hypothetical protein
MNRLEHRHIPAILTITAMCFSSIMSAQTPAGSPTPPGFTTWGSDYRVPLPKEGLVPDKETAIKIAEVILFRLYGKEDVIAQRPYKVEQEDDIWRISGTLKEGHFGSVFRIAISKRTGAILHLEH